MKLTIGILTHDLGWEQILMQIGASWTVVPDVHAISTDAFSVIVVNGEPDENASAALREYMHDGGALLGDFGHLHTVFSVPVVSRRYDSLHPDEFGRFAPSSIVDLFTKGRLLTGLSFRPDAETVQLFTAGSGYAASIPFDCSALVRSSAFRRKNFYAPTDRLPSEYVSDVAKGPVREIVTKVLEALHHARNLPFVHAWYYPRGQRSLFTFRVDTDKGSKTELAELYETCRRHGVRGTWFADVKSHEAWLDFFAAFADQEIGLHCYEHRTDTDEEAVRLNFSHGHTLLHDAGFAVRGATAPCGTWNEAVDTVYRELHLVYSSEFSLAYDDLPFYPVTERGNTLSTVLQLPIHPVCVGNMRRSAFTSDQMRDYYRAWIDNRLAAREPICLYHHPTHHHWKVFDDVFSYIAAAGIPSMTYADYAAWWKKRTARVPDISIADGTISIAGAGDDVYYRIAFPGNEETITCVDGSIDADRIERTTVPVAAAQPEGLMRARRFDPRHLLLNTLDRWYKFRSS